MKIYSILIFDVTRNISFGNINVLFVDEHNFYIINGNKSEKVTH